VGQDYSEAMKYLRRAADQDLDRAQHTYAHQLEARGELDEARDWLKRAADSGNKFSMQTLGFYFLEGKGGQKDTSAGVAMLKVVFRRFVLIFCECCSASSLTFRGVTEGGEERRT
jgi:TPR repeat protein